MPMKLRERRGAQSPATTWPSTKNSDGTNEFATTDSRDGCSVLQETQFVGTRMRVDTTRFSYVWVSLPHGELSKRGQILTSNSF